MGKVMLLDCTLRDGGYVNDWKFGHNNLVSIFERIVDAGTDIIEIGFLDECRPFDIDRSIMPDTDSVERIYGNLDRKNTLVVGMIDYGTCSLEQIRPCSESFLDGIRVIFKKHLRAPAMYFCAELKRLGYKVFAQLVSVTSYTDEEMMDLIRLANEVRPFAVSMVDTYGLMHQNNLQHYFDLLNGYLEPSIGLGYHGHNNFQMGYANCIKMLTNATERTMIVDGSLYGMGKSAGNAPVELIAMYMNANLGKRYRISQLLEAIDSCILPFYRSAAWGYNMFYYIAASNDCHPNYVSYLMDKRTLSIRSINEILRKLEGEKKLLFDREYAECLYVDYQTNEVNDERDYEALKNIFAGAKLLVIGPGMTMRTQAERVRQSTEERGTVIISINYVPDGIKPDYIFLSNAKRYVQLATRLAQEKYQIIATSNVTGTHDGAFRFVLNYGALIDLTTEIIDNSLIMLLKVLLKANVSEIYLAGFDGYTKDADNYCIGAMEYDFAKSKADYMNSYVIKFLDSVREKLKIHFVTDSRYERTPKMETDNLGVQSP